MQVQGDFLRFILNADEKQARLILKDLTKQQVDLVGEIVKNILIQPHAGKASKYLARKYYLRDISDRKKSAKFRKSLVTKHRKILWTILQMFKGNLTSTLDDIQHV